MRERRRESEKARDDFRYTRVRERKGGRENMICHYDHDDDDYDIISGEKLRFP